MNITQNSLYYIICCILLLIPGYISDLIFIKVHEHVHIQTMATSTIEKLQAFQYVERHEPSQEMSESDNTSNQDSTMFDDISAQLTSQDSKLLLSAISRAHQDFKGEIQKRLSEHESKISTNEHNIQALQHTVVSQEKTINELKTKVKELEQKSESQFLFNRRLNLVFEGVPEQYDVPLKDQIQGLIATRMKLNINIEDAFRRGSALRKGAPVVVVLSKFSDRREILKRARAMANPTGTNEDPQPPRIWINEDLPATMRDEHRKLTPLVKIARRYDSQSRVNRGKLHFKGLTYNVQQSYQLPFIDEVGIRETEDRVYFFGRYSKFSNFYPSPINNSGTVFPTVEHLYQFAKAKFHNKEDIACDIMKSADPKNAKALGDKIQEQSEWKETAAVDVMIDALKAKFRIPSFKQLLLNTRGKTLVEASPRDRFWGVATGLDQAVRNPPQLTSTNNMLGRCLMDIRETLR